MEQQLLTVRENAPAARGVYRMTLAGDVKAVAAPGQFVNLRVPGFALRRPISVCDWSEGGLTLLYKLAGGGTDAMSHMAAGTRVDALVGLGNGFDVSKSGERPLLVGGGVGTPPLYGLCKRLRAEGKRPTVLIGFRTADEILLADEFAALGARVLVTTEDGSAGAKGFVTAVMDKIDCSYFYACGPLPMLRAVDRAAKTAGEFSFEERMGCGFGVCMGCSKMTKYGAKRVCRDGPVFTREELIWED